MHPNDVVEETRRGNPRPPVVANVLQQPAFLFLFQTDLKQLEAIFPGDPPICFRISATNRLRFRVCSRNRLQLVAGGRLCVMVACKLLRVPGQQAIRPLVRHGTAILSRRHQFDDEATCVATLVGHSSPVSSVAFHATEPLLATSSCDNTAKVWRMSADGTAATCVATLAGHSHDVSSVAFHATEPLLVTGSCDNTAKLWK